MKRMLVGLVAAVAVIVAPGVATAHNAGHLFLPDGTCLEVGSFNDAPLVGQDRTQLDLVPSTPRDQFGVSFVGYWGQTPIAPGACPAVPHVAESSGDATPSITISTPGLWGR